MIGELERAVVVTPYGRRYHRINSGQRMKDAACGGFVQTNLARIPESEAREQGYSPCQICDWDTVGDGL